MSENTKTNGLHLPSLSIRRFRGINRLDIERLGRVTLLAGRNGVGKTTVLDAIQLFARHGDAMSIRDVLASHDEIEASQDDEDGRRERPAFEALFYGRRPSPHVRFSIGALGDDAPLAVEAVTAEDLPSDWVERLGRQRGVLEGPILRITFQTFTEYQPVLSEEFGETHLVAMGYWKRVRGLGEKDWPDNVPSILLGPGIADNWQLAEHWDEVALTPNENLALEALELAGRTKIEGVAPIRRPRRSAARQMMVKPAQGDRVPLRSLGEGAVRTLGTVLGLVNAREGFLLIDEAENGIHHTLLRDYWTMVLSAAREHNVQVLATTHSWDCIAGFAEAAFKDESSEGVVVRLEPEDEEGSLRSIEYSEADLHIAATQGIEVR